jgi:hypothetical protein
MPKVPKGRFCAVVARGRPPGLSQDAAADDGRAVATVYVKAAGPERRRSAGGLSNIPYLFAKEAHMNRQQKEQTVGYLLECLEAMERDAAENVADRSETDRLFLWETIRRLGHLQVELEHASRMVAAWVTRTG